MVSILLGPFPLRLAEGTRRSIGLRLSAVKLSTADREP